MIGALLLGGSALLQGVGGYQQAKQQAKMNNILGRRKLAQQEINNAEARRAGDQEHNMLNININKSYDQFVNADANIDVARMQARSEAVVSAASVGTAGMSVDDSILDIERNAAKAEANEYDKLFGTINALELQRESIEAKVRSRTTNDIFLPSAKPSALGAALGIAGSVAGATYGKTWDESSFNFGSSSKNTLTSFQASRM
jgi:hypothetical protein